MVFLDIPSLPHQVIHRPRIIKPEVIDTASVPSDTTDTVATALNVSGDNLQMADIAPSPSLISGIPDDVTLSIVVVLIALSVCFYFVKRYRKTRR